LMFSFTTVLQNRLRVQFSPPPRGIMLCTYNKWIKIKPWKNQISLIFYSAS
jgi:hypothetical protein